MIKSVTATDESSVEIVLNRPSPGFLSALSVTTAGMISPASVTADGNTNENYQHPVGTGPYTFTDYVAGQSVKVTKFADYWGEQPYYENVEFRVVPEAATRESLLLAGQVDMIILPPVSDIAALQNNSAVKVILGESDRSIYIALDNNDPLLSNPKVRQALNYAVDKQTIIKSVLFGAASRWTHRWRRACSATAAPAPTTTTPPRPADAGRDRCGGGELDLLTPSGRYVQDQQASEAIAGYLREVGLNVNVSTSDFPSFLARVNAAPSANTVDMHMLGWAPAYLDADMQMQMFRQATHPPPVWARRSTPTPGRGSAGAGRHRDQPGRPQAAVLRRVEDHLGRRRPGSSCGPSPSPSSTPPTSPASPPRRPRSSTPSTHGRRAESDHAAAPASDTGAGAAAECRRGSRG